MAPCLGDTWVYPKLKPKSKIKVRLDQRQMARRSAETKAARADPRHVDFKKTFTCRVFCYTSTGSPDGIDTFLSEADKDKTQLLDLLDEILIKILSISLACFPANRLQISLICKKLHDLAISSKREAAIIIVQAYDPLAAVILPPPANEDPLVSWMPHVAARAEQVQKILRTYAEVTFIANAGKDHVSCQLNAIHDVDGPGNPQVLKIGLYILELLHFQQKAAVKHAQINAFIDNLPPHALLVLRFTTIVTTAILTFRYNLSDAMAQMDHFVQINPTFSEMLAVVSRVLLSRTIELPKDRFYMGDRCPGPLFRDVRETIRSTEYCRRLGSGHSLYPKLTRNWYEILLADRIESEFEGLGNDHKELGAVMARVESWIAGRSDLEVLMEIKKAVAAKA